MRGRIRTFLVLEDGFQTTVVVGNEILRNQIKSWPETKRIENHVRVDQFIPDWAIELPATDIVSKHVKKGLKLIMEL